MVTPVEEDDTSTACCKLHAYCLMPNHVHLLIEELGDEIGTVMKRIGIAYVSYYNKHYDRSGPLFEDRFKSEPVGDVGYFVTLLRYIHQNPVAGGIVRNVGDYTWSSWREYEEGIICQMPVCNTEHVFSRISREDLTALVNEPLSKTLKILDFDNETNIRLTDEKVREFLASVMGTQNLLAIQQLPKKERNRIIQMARQYGSSIRQLNRLTGISEGIIRNIKITQ